ncbi:MAG: beta-N-acetylhexosaminidase, partial [Candidatus Binatia bacterium]
VGCSGERLSRDERLIYAEYGFGGFILFRHNCCEPRQILSLCRSLWDDAPGLPPFIAIDAEGGKVHRLPPPFTHFPAAAALGARNDLTLTYRAGRATAAELALVGINLNFAPVLDVNSNPDNPIIGERAFGADPRLVSAMGAAWMCGLRDGGVIPCGKHFPGHGDTHEDSHLALPVVTKSLARLQAVEFVPFVDRCRDGIEALMTAHVKFTALDPNHVATLSEPIVTGLLRHQLGYDGVVFSDDMEMRAVSEHHDPGEAAALAVRAGIDAVLFCHDLEKAVHALEFLCAEADQDPALRARVEASHRRIGALKQRCLKEFSGAAVNEIEDRLTRLNHRRIVEEIHGNLYAL